MHRLIFIFLALTFLSVLPLSNSMAGDRVIIKHYSYDYNVTGYSKIEDGRETHFSKNWDRTGYSIHRDGGRIDHYDRDWRRQGQSEINDYEKKEDFNDE